MSMIVTGAASGIGRAVAELAASAGRSLTLVDRDAAGLAEVAESARGLGAEVETCVVDLSTSTAGDEIVDAAVRRFGTLDALVSNAGVITAGSLSDATVEEFDLSLAVNTRAAWLLGRAARPHLAATHGSITVTASLAATHPTPLLGAYSASKAAVVMLVRQMAVEWGPDGIRVNTVSPGPTVSGMTRGVFGDPTQADQRANRELRESFVPLRRVAAAEDIARAVLFLAGTDAGHVSGVDLVVDGGLSNGLMSAVGGGSGHRPVAQAGQ